MVVATATYSLSQLLDILGPEHTIVGGDRTATFDRVSPIDQAVSTSLSWIKEGHPRKTELLTSSDAGIIICDLKTSKEVPSDTKKVLILCPKPRLSFLRVVKELFSPPQPHGIHETAIIHPQAIVGDSVFIGPGCYVGRCKIGNGVMLWGHNYLYDGVNIGDRSSIDVGTVLGAPGFGYSKNEFGEWEFFPHIGGVEVGTDVEIGANSCIDRGTLGNTVIEDRAKIDNLVHIGHNARIGEGALIIANAQIAGSVKIGKRSWIAPSATILNALSIGEGATVGIGAIVTENVPDGAKLVSQPAKMLPKAFWEKKI